MPQTILMTFATDTDRDAFLAAVRHDSDERLEADPEEPTGLLYKDALASVKLNPPIKSQEDRVAALFVAGQKLSEGPLAQVMRSFDSEIAAHKATVEIRELINGEWQQIRIRRSH